MTTLFGTILAAALMAQLQGRTIQGKVVDEAGKPVAGAQVVFQAPAPWGSKVEPVEVRATTDAGGGFRLVIPSLRGVYVRRARVWAFHPGRAFAAEPGFRELLQALVLHKTMPRTVKIEGPDGRPVAGARVSPRGVSFADGRNLPDIPASLAEPRTVTTGPDGKATLDYLAVGDKVVAVRVAAESIGTQDFQLVEQPLRDGQGAEITLRLKPTSHLAGRVRTRAGEPGGGQPVEVWFKGGISLEANPVRFKNGPLLTAADGSFQTPDNLLVGSPYRVVVRTPGMEPILSDWITIGDKPRVLLPMIQRPLRTLSGRVVDRQGKPLAGIEVFQSGDGPERTATKSAADGQFMLSGFRQGAIFLFARGDGFRFFGQLIKPGDRDITVELTRTSERPAVEMRMLPDPIPPEESRALALRLIKPYLDDFENESEATKVRALRLLATADPVGVLHTLETVELASSRVKSAIKIEAAGALARTDPAQAEAVARAIEVPELQVMGLLTVVHALPDKERDRKLALLGRAAVQTKAVTVPRIRLDQIGEVAERWFELGEKEKAKALFAEGLLLANQPAVAAAALRGRFAARLSLVDPASALAIVEAFPASETYYVNLALRNIAFRLAADNPALAERVLRQIRPEIGQDWLPPAIAWRMAKVDPARAVRLVEESQRSLDHPQMYLFLAHGLASRDKAAALEAFQTAMRGIDRSMNEGSEYAPVLPRSEVLLPLVEQIDPALVPEYFWRVVATRPSLGDPGATGELSQGLLVALLAWYDRDVAAALFEPVRARMEQTDDQTLARSSVEFLAWSIFDPRAAVAWFAQVPVDPKLELNTDLARRELVDVLGRAHDERWQRTWSTFTEMGDLFGRELK